MSTLFYLAVLVLSCSGNRAFATSPDDRLNDKIAKLTWHLDQAAAYLDCLKDPYASRHLETDAATEQIHKNYSPDLLLIAQEVHARSKATLRAVHYIARTISELDIELMFIKQNSDSAALEIIDWETRASELTTFAQNYSTAVTEAHLGMLQFFEMAALPMLRERADLKSKFLDVAELLFDDFINFHVASAKIGLSQNEFFKRLELVLGEIEFLGSFKNRTTDQKARLAFLLRQIYVLNAEARQLVFPEVQSSKITSQNTVDSAGTDEWEILKPRLRKAMISFGAGFTPVILEKLTDTQLPATLINVYLLGGLSIGIAVLSGLSDAMSENFKLNSRRFSEARFERLRSHGEDLIDFSSDYCRLILETHE